LGRRHTSEGRFISYIINMSDTLKERIAAMEAQNAEIREDIKDLAIEVRKLYAVMNMGKGVWRFVTAVGILLGILLTGNRLFN